MVEISNEMYERLRQILEKQNGKTYTFEEVKEIGDGLLDLYTLLISIYTEAEEPMLEDGMTNAKSGTL
ncbi:MAG TPA: hypothetical protein VK694_04525 [Verrucomicrobiae bacterium]|nr:hypothetical protein [Verrucomicrobiae bacterium]